MLSEEQILSANILIIDDNVLNVQILKKILSDAGFQNLTLTTDSTKALSLYQEKHPDLVLLDFKMPVFNGIEVMEQFHAHEPEGYMPVLMITAEQDESLRGRAFQAGAKDFLHKPYDRLDVILRSRNLIETCKLYKQIRGQNKTLEENVKERTNDLYQTRMDVVWRLAKVAEFRDEHTGEHINRMSRYAHVLARGLGLSLGQCELILNTVVLHDIGKVAVPDAILLKPAKLEPQEFEIMKKHTIWGAQMLKGSDSAFLKMAETIAISHHEKYDGTGYPNGLKGDSIPLVGRIAAVADVFDALTSSRPYKKAWSLEEAIMEIKKMNGSHFDPRLVEIFLDNSKEVEVIYKSYH